ncbi:copine protein (macronuclear) [Tetrahymena thermophila SB210]|uniref:Copine protein n=1 Tax=Tetrahymena thermophila (strain SB210) TaxID=312017 RepID=Q23A17_TETTS|nr:copine protein [Tetrahymena thermophila SB210]EAR93346.1 copine protein [Tetrahymena thermophila SB210]|eukprot:XP_001013591.1 copine protein [Tetrahymena thermophila SB210]
MFVQETFQKVDITISCRSLKDADVFSKSDPLVVVRMKNTQNGSWYEIGRTETIQNNLNPNFKRSLQLDYMFEQKQELHLQVLDSDGSSFDHLGEAFTTLGAIVGAKNNTLILDLTDQKTKKKINKSKIILIAEKINDCNNVIFTQWRGVKLMNTDGWFDKSDPFLRFKRIREDNTEVLIHETEKIMDNLNPIWKPFELPLNRLCNGDHLRPIKVECWDWEKSQKHQFIGEFTFTIDQLNSGKKEFDLKNPKSKKPGKIELTSYRFIERPSFLEYIRGNTQLNLVVCVDFTASNGAVSTPQSLHYQNPQVMNAYQQAIYSVGEILLDYDFDKKVPCYGFGGVPRYPTLTFPSAQHCFPMSGNPQNSEAFGLGEIMNLYNYSLQHVSLSGPTLFNPILQETIQIAQMCKNQGSIVYTIMLILTDGEIHDMNETIDSLVYASNLPLSVIIVGIGNADFANMERLDGDDSGLVNSKGQRATRDIVQFVPFRNYKGNGQALCKEVLAEIPQQLVSYMTQMGIRPQPAPAINQTQIHMNQSAYPQNNMQQQPLQNLAQNMNAFLQPHIQSVEQQQQIMQLTGQNFQYPPPPPANDQQQYGQYPVLNNQPNQQPNLQYQQPPQHAQQQGIMSQSMNYNNPNINQGLPPQNMMNYTMQHKPN